MATEVILADATSVLADQLLAEDAPGWAPPPQLTIAEWAQLKRKLPETSAAKGGPWRNETAPYLVEPMNSMRCARDDNNREVKKVAWMKAGQTGGSSAIENALGYHIEHDPCAILMVHPTDEAVEEWSKDRFDDLIRSTPELSERVRERKPPRAAKHQSGSTIKHKVYPGGQLFAGSAKTPNTFARRSARLIFADDFERWPYEVGEEGDPGDLLVARGASFHDALIVYVSTPALAGGRIDTLYRASDQRRFFVRCPHCGREDWITWSSPDHFRVTWDARNASTARVECPDVDHGGCGAQMGEAQRREMVLAAGEHGWRPTAEAKEAGLRGYHLPAMISTLAGVTLEWMVSAFLAAHAKGLTALRVFINTILGEGWVESGTRVEATALQSRREAYPDDVDMPAGAVVLTAGVDVQADRFALQVIGWGLGLERWLVDWRAIPGDPKRPETQAALLDALRTRYRHEGGHDLPVIGACVDSGYATDDVYAFVMRNGGGVPKLWATKGAAGHLREPLIYKRGKIERDKTGKVRLVPWGVNADEGKAEIVDALEKKTHGPGSLHLSEAMADEAYLAELTNEHKEIVRNRSGVAVKTIWVQDGPNEALDTIILARAALHILAGGVNPAAWIRRMATALAEKSALPSGDGGRGPTPPPARRPTERRVWRANLG